MTIQYSGTVRDAKNDAIETAIGASPKLYIFSGTTPANCAAADANGTPLAIVNLPADWMAASSGGVKSILGGPWTDSSADNSGTASHFRIKNNAATVVHMQGTVGTSASDMIVDSVSFTSGQQFSINSFTITSGNA